MKQLMKPLHSKAVEQETLNFADLDFRFAGRSALQTWASAARTSLLAVADGVTAIRRRSQRGLKLEPYLDLIEGDVVALIGSAAAVMAGEERLLRGKTK